LKPQAFLRQIVHASLPLGTGIIADPFMGSGSTIAASEAVGLTSIGAERYLDYYEVSRKAIPRLAALVVEPLEDLQASLLDLT
jgi:site-specific DNA-methyltransferase (adenine-specific)